MTIEEIEERRKEYGHISNHPVLKDVDWLIQRIEDLELTRNKAERCSCIFEADGETILRWCDAHKVWRDRVKELEDKLSTYCAYCGKMYPLDVDTSLISEHIRTCGKHPLVRRIKELEIYTQQLRGALGYSVPGNIRENPEIHNGIAEALQQRVESLEANLAREMTYKETVEALERDLKYNTKLLALQCDLAREAETKVMELVNGIKKHRVDRYDNPIPENEWGNGGYDYYDEELYRLVEGKP